MEGGKKIKESEAQEEGLEERWRRLNMKDWVFGRTRDMSSTRKF